VVPVALKIPRARSGRLWRGALLFLVFSAAGCITEPELKPGRGHVPEVLQDGWRVATPEQVGLDPTALDEVYARFYSGGEMLNALALLVVKDGWLVAEGYARDPGDRDRIRNTQSITKSVTSLAFGVLHADGVFSDLDEPLSAVLPSQSFTGDPRTREITLRHLLTMRSGLDLDNRDFSRELLMRRPRGQDRFILARPLRAAPGVRFDYRDADPQLVSYAVQVRTGRSLEEVARERLFGPLGIQDHYWESNVDGVTLGAHALWLRPRDLAKLGQLVLDEGVWGGERVVPGEWIRESTGSRADHRSPEGFGYGYYWWLAPVEGAVAAWGHGGQHVVIVPSRRLVLVLTALPDTNDDRLGNGLASFLSVLEPLLGGSDGG
jgi:CubicO group peptidase (beta-lactamase class C family)